MTGTRPDGRSIDVTILYITMNGKPVLPVSGEMHFSRYPNQFWEEELLKMKACGINVIATYIFWIHHEEVKDVFDWSGDRDLHAFVKLCAKHGLLVFLRLGPFCHGECRNGGIPDWMWNSPIKRTADPAFLERTRILYREIAKQVDGLLFKDGGPVVMVQLENEMCDGEKGISYMRALKRIAKEVGIDVPIYTATGWGNSSIPPGELIPTFGGYPESPWDVNFKPYGTDHSKNFFFTPERDDGFIDNMAVVNDVKRSKYRHPYLTCETGPGIQVTYSRRPVIQPADVLSLAIVKLASGANMIGYYVFHGGTHPVGKLTTMEESLGRPSILIYPTYSYDFQAPLGEFGQVRRSYHLYRLLHLFLNEFGDRLAPAVPILPTEYPTRLDDADMPRAAVRVKDGAGFVFFNNHDRYNPKMHDIPGISFKIEAASETMSFPSQPIVLKKGQFGILPFNLDASGVLLRHAIAQLITSIENDGERTFVFFQLDGMTPEFAFVEDSVDFIRVPAGMDGKIQRAGGRVVVTDLKPGRDAQIRATSTDGRQMSILLLSADDAEHFWKGHAFGQERAMISARNVYFDNDDAVLYGQATGDATLSVFPAGGLVLSVGGKALEPAVDGMFSKFVLPRTKKPGQVNVEAVPDRNDPDSWLIEIPRDALDGCQDLFMAIDYVGNSATLHVNGKAVADDFYTGVPWVVGIKRWAPGILDTGARLTITPLETDDEIYLEKWPAAEKGTKTIRHLISIKSWKEQSVRIEAAKAAR
jgi:hypothetical protein